MSQGPHAVLGFCCWDKITRTKSSLGRKGVISLSLPCPGPLKAVRAKAQGRILEVGTDTEAVEGAAYWLAPFGLLHLLFFL